jgi:hypothetical protein
MIKTAFLMNRHSSPLPRAQARKDSVIIWRTFGETLNEENGFFSIVPGSQNLGADEAKKAKMVKFELKKNQAAIMDGNVWISWGKEGGGYGQYYLFQRLDQESVHQK